MRKTRRDAHIVLKPEPYCNCTRPLGHDAHIVPKTPTSDRNGWISMPDLQKRKPLRLKEYDYSADGAYFLTVCTADRKCILSRIITDDLGTADVELTEYGMVAEAYIKTIPGIDRYVIMPNHIHLIIQKANGKSIANDVRSFKILVTRKLGQKIWQDRFYDHVIRDEEDYYIKARYIENNPARWQEDEYAPLSE